MLENVKEILSVLYFLGYQPSVKDQTEYIDIIFGVHKISIYPDKYVFNGVVYTKLIRREFYELCETITIGPKNKTKS